MNEKKEAQGLEERKERKVFTERPKTGRRSRTSSPHVRVTWSRKSPISNEGRLTMPLITTSTTTHNVYKPDIPYQPCSEFKAILLVFFLRFDHIHIRICMFSNNTARIKIKQQPQTSKVGKGQRVNYPLAPLQKQQAQAT